MNFAFIGSGFIMPRHEESVYHVGGNIISVTNTSRAVDAWRDAVRNPAVDCVTILTPNDLHVEIALAAADAGKMVLCEKPMALCSSDIEILSGRSNIFGVLQLRYHDVVKRLKSAISDDQQYDIEMEVLVHRDPSYYQIWKGQPERSGGILFNLGVHYFDMITYLFGEQTKAVMTFFDRKTGRGVIEGNNYCCRWALSTAEPRETQRRIFRINGVDYNFSSKDNLGHENLHRFVYEDLIRGKGVCPQEMLPSTRLIEQLYESASCDV